jgi:uncharacterized protein (PEP-CTERM system associated)
MAPAARTQTLQVQPALEIAEGVTSNATGAQQGEARPDLITTIRPTLQVTSRSRLLKLDATIGADAIAYARELQPNRVFPVFDANATAQVIERLLAIDSSVVVHAAERDPYAARSDAAQTQNQEVVSVYRISPVIDRDLAHGATLHARYEAIVEHGDADSASNQRFTNTEARLAWKPMPLGGSIGYESHAIHYSFPADSAWKIETLKASGDVALGGGQFVLGPSIGSERTTLLFDSRSDTSYGAHLAWTPSERTRLTAEAEHRFFGTGWQMEFRHRMPWVTFAVLWSRAPIDSSTSLGVAGADGLNSFLDSILTTRYPDASARGAIVDGLVANRGLQGAAATPIDIRADYVQLQNKLNANAVFLGGRNIVAVGVYMLTARGLAVPGDVLQNALSGASDSRQVGASLDVNRKLEARLTADFSADWSRITSLGAGPAQTSSSQSYRLALIRALSPHTSLSLALRRESLRTNLATLNSYAATSAYVSMSHKF